jgi:hypothetical protein
MPSSCSAVEDLRVQIQRRWHSAIAHEARACTRGRLSGFPQLDALLAPAGIPSGQLLEISGQASSGKTGLALAIAAAFLRSGDICAYVDPQKSFFAPFAAAGGVDLKRLLIVRPQDATAMRRAIDALVRAGAFAAVVIDCSQNPSAVQTHHCTRLVAQAAKNGTTLVALSHGNTPALASCASLRLHAGDIAPLWQPGSDGEDRLCGYRTSISLIKSRSIAPGRSVMLNVLLPDVYNTWPSMQARDDTPNPLDEDESYEPPNRMPDRSALFHSGMLASKLVAERAAASAG